MKFVPIDQTPEIICEVDSATIFADTEAAYQQVRGNAFHKWYDLQGERFEVNIGNERYHVLNKNPRCVCCGIHGTRMFLGRFEEDGISGYNFRLFAETRDRPNTEPHLVLMTKDHIIPKKDGGPDELSNYQTLCWLCNTMKNMVGLTLEQIRGCMFTAYRIYRGTLTLRKTQEKLERTQQEYERCLRAVENIGGGLDKVQDAGRREEMIAKQQRMVERATYLQQAIIDAERTAQVTGVVPDKITL